MLSDPVRLAILQALAETDEATASELMGRGHVSYRAVHRHLDALVAVGIVRELESEGGGEAPGRPARRFSLEPSVARRAKALFAVLGEPLVFSRGRSPAPRRGR